jgi:hypothetical protein
MVQALVELDDNTNQILSIIKAKYNLNTKGEAIQLVVQEYSEREPEIRPALVSKIKSIEKQKSIKVKDFSRRYGLK